MYSHRLLVVGMILAPKSRCSVPGSFEDETYYAHLHHIHTRESPSEYSERRYWSTLMYMVLKFLSCLQFQYQTAGIRKLLVRWCGLIFLHSYLGGVLKFFDIWLGLAASSNVKEFQYSSSVTVQEYPRPAATVLIFFAPLCPLNSNCNQASTQVLATLQPSTGFLGK